MPAKAGAQFISVPIWMNCSTITTSPRPAARHNPNSESRSDRRKSKDSPDSTSACTTCRDRWFGLPRRQRHAALRHAANRGRAGRIGNTLRATHTHTHTHTPPPLAGGGIGLSKKSSPKAWPTFDSGAPSIATPVIATSCEKLWSPQSHYSTGVTLFRGRGCGRRRAPHALLAMPMHGGRSSPHGVPHPRCCHA